MRVTDKSKIQIFGQNLRKIQEQQSKYQPNKSKGDIPSKAFDMPDGSDEPERVLVETHRIIRDTKIARKVKFLHEYKCQICGEAIDLGNGKHYAEAHHIKPLGGKHKGPDVIENILCVCPNHHAQLDFGAIKININSLRNSLGHEISDDYVQYHNLSIFQDAG